MNEKFNESFSGLVLAPITGGPRGSRVCQVAAPPLILLSQAKTPTQTHKIKLQMLADVPVSQPHSHLPLDPCLSVLSLTMVLNSASL